MYRGETINNILFLNETCENCNKEKLGTALYLIVVAIFPDNKAMQRRIKTGYLVNTWERQQALIDEIDVKKGDLEQQKILLEELKQLLLEVDNKEVKQQAKQTEILVKGLEKVITKDEKALKEPHVVDTEAMSKVAIEKISDFLATNETGDLLIIGTGSETMISYVCKEIAPLYDGEAKKYVRNMLYIYESPGGITLSRQRPEDRHYIRLYFGPTKASLQINETNKFVLKELGQEIHRIESGAVAKYQGTLKYATSSEEVIEYMTELRGYVTKTIEERGSCYLAVDFETTMLDVYKEYVGKDTHRIIAVSFTASSEVSYSFPIDHRDITLTPESRKMIIDFLEYIANEQRLFILMWNAQFDLRCFLFLGVNIQKLRLETDVMLLAFLSNENRKGLLGGYTLKNWVNKIYHEEKGYEDDISAEIVQERKDTTLTRKDAVADWILNNHSPELFMYLMEWASAALQKKLFTPAVIKHYVNSRIYKVNDYNKKLAQFIETIREEKFKDEYLNEIIQICKIPNIQEEYKTTTFEDYDVNKLLMYAAKDTAFTYDLYFYLIDEAKREFLQYKKDLAGTGIHVYDKKIWNVSRTILSPASKVFAKMSFEGLRINLDRAAQYKETLQTEIPALEQAIKAQTGIENLNSGPQMKEYLSKNFEYFLKIAYERGFAEGVKRMENFKATLESETPPSEEVARNTLVGLLDNTELEITGTVKEHIEKNWEHLKELSGMLAAEAKRAVVLDLIDNPAFFDEVKAGDKEYSDVEEFIKTDKNVMAKLQDATGCGEFSDIARYKLFSKLLGTYVKPFIEKTTYAGRLHGSFFLNQTATGRVAANDPNLQNLPKPSKDPYVKTKGINIKDLIEVDDTEIYYMFNVDISNAEGRVGASLTRDQLSLDIIHKGLDNHCLTAAAISEAIVGVKYTYEEVKAAVAKKEPKMVRLREIAKSMNFALLFGAGAMGLSYSLKIPIEQAEELLRLYQESYTGSTAFMVQSLKQVDLVYKVQSPFGRFRRFPILESYKGQKLTTSDQRKYDKHRNKARKQSTNAIIQSASSDILLQNMVAMDAYLTEHNLGRVLLTVHDSIAFQFRKDSLDMLGPMLDVCLKDKAWEVAPFLKEQNIVWEYDEEWLSGKRELTYMYGHA